MSGIKKGPCGQNVYYQDPCQDPCQKPACVNPCQDPCKAGPQHHGSHPHHHGHHGHHHKQDPCNPNPCQNQGSYGCNK